MALRFSSERIDATTITKTGAGALKVSGIVTRSGVFEYRDSAGKVVREWRPPEEVTKADSIASMADLPVTIRHPKVFVDPSNWEALSIGHVSAPRVDASIVGAAADIIISKGSAHGGVGKDLKEISYGYRVRIDETPGVVPAGCPDAGKPYDVIQRDIVGNHVALGPTNWGRQGSSVSLRLDSAGDECPPADPHATEGVIMHKIRIDGIEFSADTEAGLQAKVDAHYAAKTVEATKAAAATEAARADALEKANVKLAADLEIARKDALDAPAKLAARQTLETDAKALLGNSAKFDSKSDRDIQIEVIKKFDSEFAVDANTSDDVVKATYAVWAKAGAQLAKGKRADSTTRRIAGALGGLGGEKPEGREDGTPEVDETDSDAARKRRQQRADSGEGAFSYTRDGAIKQQAAS